MTAPPIRKEQNITWGSRNVPIRKLPRGKEITACAKIITSFGRDLDPRGHKKANGRPHSIAEPASFRERGHHRKFDWQTIANLPQGEKGPRSRRGDYQTGALHKLGIKVRISKLSLLGQEGAPRYWTLQKELSEKQVLIPGIFSPQNSRTFKVEGRGKESLAAPNGEERESRA